METLVVREGVLGPPVGDATWTLSETLMLRFPDAEEPKNPPLDEGLWYWPAASVPGAWASACAWPSKSNTSEPETQTPTSLNAFIGLPPILLTPPALFSVGQL